MQGFDDPSLKTLAMGYVEDAFDKYDCSKPPPLEMLAIGSTPFSDRLRTGEPDLHSTVWNQTYFFTIDWARTRFGKWAAMATRVEEDYMEDFRGELPLGGIFEQSWLR